jgi:Ser-tRNA(Ala) deacylase AlaX
MSSISIKVDDNIGSVNTAEVMVPATEILYMTYEGNFVTECTATILDVVVLIKNDNNSNGTADGAAAAAAASANAIATQTNPSPREYAIVLDRTVMHAQGGGQPTDIGQIIKSCCYSSQSLPQLRLNGNDDETTATTTTNNTTTINTDTTTMQISKVLLDRDTGIVKHYGTIMTSEVEGCDDETLSSIRIGDVVQVQVNVKQRLILSECHTAGHVVDAAMIRCGYRLKPSKGYHFLDSPYVEYVGAIMPTKSASPTDVLHQLQDAFQELLQENIDTQIEVLSKEEADVRCNGTYDNSNNNDNTSEKVFDMDMYCCTKTELVRIVTVAGYPCPCGGTHVRSTGELLHNRWGITGMKSKKGRIKYGQEVVTQQ